MKNILVTGSDGFMGRNIVLFLRTFEQYHIETFDQDNDQETLENSLQKAEIIFHLAGANRPEKVEEFDLVNRGLTKKIADFITKQKLSPVIVFASSIQATLDNPYGLSKKAAEEVLIKLCQNTKSDVFIYRFSNLYGKWSLPNYNSVVATFCYNIARNKPIQINDPNQEITLIYIDDILKNWKRIIDKELKQSSSFYHEIEEFQTITLGNLAEIIKGFRASRDDLFLPNFKNLFVKKLYTTYLSYLDENNFSYPLKERVDERGRLIELFKSDSFGQVFISSTKKGVIRGKHYHHSKVEKFFVVKGEAIIKFRKIEGNKVISYHVSGTQPEMVDIPPGYTHSIENISDSELIVLFWANEPFDPQNPDTYHSQVVQ